MNVPNRLRITVDYGYDIHAIAIDRVLFDRAKAGKPVTVKGQGFRVGGEATQDWWAFNELESGSFQVYCEDGRDVFVGSIDDVWQG